MFRRPGKPARSVYMDEVDRIDDRPRQSYFTQRHIRYEEEPRRAQSLTVKSSKQQRPTWQPVKAPKEPTDDNSPTSDQKDTLLL